MLSSTPEHNSHANDIDFQIEADPVGLMHPGMLKAPNELCLRAGRVMNYGDGIYGGMFDSSMYAEAKITFDGMGAIITGPYFSTGGTSEVYLDGELHKKVDVYPDEESCKYGDSVWHAFGLDDGEHTVRLVVIGKPY